MSDLTDFLLARIAEDEAQARTDYVIGMTGAQWQEYPADAYYELQTRTLEAGKRLAAECEAKRRIVELHSGEAPWCGWTQDGDTYHSEIHNGFGVLVYCDTLRTLAIPYKDHEEFREEWKP